MSAGGYGPQHRKVRRVEELIWIRRNDFKRVISIIPTNHNLHNYEEFDIECVHRPINIGGHLNTVLSVLYSDLNKLIKNNERLLLHHEEVGDTWAEPLQVILFGMGLLNLFLKQ